MYTIWQYLYIVNLKGGVDFVNVQYLEIRSSITLSIGVDETESRAYHHQTL